MTTKPQLVCWDSCVIIDYLGEHSTRYAEILPMIDSAKRDELLIVVSEISVAEVSKLESLMPKGVTLGKQIGLIEDFFGLPYVQPRIIDRPIARLAAQLGRNFGVKTCDAIVLATAIVSRADVVVTYDGHKDDGLRKKTLALDGQIPTNTPGKKLAIKPPLEYGQLGLL